LHGNVVEEISGSPLLKKHGIAGPCDETRRTRPGSSLMKEAISSPDGAGAVNLGLASVAGKNANRQGGNAHGYGLRRRRGRGGCRSGTGVAVANFGDRAGMRGPVEAGCADN